LSLCAQTARPTDRALWASINGKKDASLGDYQQHTGKVLVTWRMLPGDDAETAFDLYRTIGTGQEKRIASGVKKATCFQDATASKTADNVYRLTYAGSDETLSTFTLTRTQVSAAQPYISIPLRDTKDVYADTKKIVYTANDVSVGDLDGDGEFEIVVKRLQSVKDASGNIVSDGSGASYSQQDCLYAVIWDAYKLDGTFLWRIKGGPGIILGNSSAFAIADLDGDGCAEMAIRTCEGTVFGDGQEIPDTNGDGKIDYRTWGNLNSSSPGWVDHYNSAGPEFISIIDGKTGRELARDNFIDRATSSSWGDNYWKRASSFRVGVGCFDETGLPSVVFGRGVYARSVIEAWDWRDGQLTRRWRFDTTDGGRGKDGKRHSTYAAQGNHSLNVADLDGDGLDEVMYGSMAVDDDGIGLWNTGLGHGDANHVGKFLPEREGLQMFHCLESGKTMVALHDARDGKVIWKKDASSDNDMGRCLVGDFLPQYPGCEFFYYQGNYIQQDGTETSINTKGQKGGCGMAIWFDGSLSRQLIEDNIIHSPANGRTFTMYRYNETFINGTKSNPSWYGDLVGDWREEVILPDQSRVQDLKIFSTWYPTTHKFPWLMADHTYWLSALNENIGYNQPTNLGYYLGTDLKSDAEAWEQGGFTSGILSLTPDPSPKGEGSAVYDLSGRKVSDSHSSNLPSLQGGAGGRLPGGAGGRLPGGRLPKGIYIQNGKKFVVR
jgi:rhamnogalacturonan endolyase